MDWAAPPMTIQKRLLCNMNLKKTTLEQKSTASQTLHRKNFDKTVRDQPKIEVGQVFIHWLPTSSCIFIRSCQRTARQDIRQVNTGVHWCILWDNESFQWSLPIVTLATKVYHNWPRNCSAVVSGMRRIRYLIFLLSPVLSTFLIRIRTVIILVFYSY